MQSREYGSQLYRVAKDICKVLKVNVEKCQYIGNGMEIYFFMQNLLLRLPKEEHYRQPVFEQDKYRIGSSRNAKSKV